MIRIKRTVEQKPLASFGTTGFDQPIIILIETADKRFTTRERYGPGLEQAALLGLAIRPQPPRMRFLPDSALEVPQLCCRCSVMLSGEALF